MDPTPLVSNTYAPLRGIFEALGNRGFSPRGGRHPSAHGHA